MAIPTEQDERAAHVRSIAASAISLAAIGVILTLAAFAVAQLTQERIARSEQAWIQRHLTTLLEPVNYDNDVLTDTISMVSRDLLRTSTPTTIYRARLDGKPVAAVIRAIAPDGYRGPIELLVAVAWNGTLIGVQVLRHDETPGLGDAFETRDADWLAAFEGLSLSNPPQQRWTVRKDGGDFDSFTGATITPRAIVKAVRRSLEFFRANRERLFEASDERLATGD